MSGGNRNARQCFLVKDCQGYMHGRGAARPEWCGEQKKWAAEKRKRGAEKTKTGVGRREEKKVYFRATVSITLSVALFCIGFVTYSCSR